MIEETPEEQEPEEDLQSLLDFLNRKDEAELEVVSQEITISPDSEEGEQLQAFAESLDRFFQETQREKEILKRRPPKGFTRKKDLLKNSATSLDWAKDLPQFSKDDKENLDVQIFHHLFKQAFTPSDEKEKQSFRKFIHTYQDELRKGNTVEKDLEKRRIDIKAEFYYRKSLALLGRGKESKLYPEFLACLLVAGYYGFSEAKPLLHEHLQELREKTYPEITNPKQKLVEAHCYLTGMGRKQNPKKAALLYRKLATEENMPEAQFALGMCYIDGIALKQNHNTGRIWLKKAMLQSYAPATLEYALCFLYGRGVEQNPEAAIDLFEECANRGVAFASTIVGICYEHGIFRRKDSRMALGFLARGKHNNASVDQLGEELHTAIVELICQWGKTE